MVRFILFSWLALVGLTALVSCQEIPLWASQPLQKELLRPYFLDSLESTDYERPSSANSFPNSIQSSGGIKKRVAAMGVDLPDYILNFRGKSPDLGAFRERMQISGRR